MSGASFRSLFSGLAVLWTAATVVPIARGAVPDLLQQAVQNWSAGKDDWALTQRVRELDDDGRVQQERLERYDPTKPDNQRWQLLELNGTAPPQEQKERWEKWKNARPRKRSNKTPAELLEMERATVVEETAQAVTYAIALRPEAARLVQVEKLTIRVTVGRATKAVERVTVGLREPMRVALGLAKVTDIDLDVHFASNGQDQPAPATPQGAPRGNARAAVSVLGNRVEYEWSDFKRVQSYRNPTKK